MSHDHMRSKQGITTLTILCLCLGSRLNCTCIRLYRMRAVSLYLTGTRASFLRTYDHKLTTSLWYYYHISHPLPEKTSKMLLIKNRVSATSHEITFNQWHTTGFFLIKQLDKCTQLRYLTVVYKCSPQWHFTICCVDCKHNTINEIGQKPSTIYWYRSALPIVT